MRSSFLTFLMFLISAGYASGQQQQSAELSGGVRGIVKEADFLTPIANVRIRLEGTTIAASSDSDGNYFLNQVPPGTYVLVASREGFTTERVTGVLVSPGMVTQRDVDLSAEVFELEAFVVTADDLLAGDEGAQLLSIRQELTGFSDAIGAEFISAVGASDAGEALTKIVGTSVVDSRYVVVRGLSDRYNVVVLNGATIPSSDPDRRAVNVDIFPGGLIQALTNTKTFTPNISGQSTGGFIDVVTTSIPDENSASFSVGGGYRTNATLNRNFVGRPPATGILGTANDRQIPGFLIPTTTRTLPKLGAGTMPALTAALREGAATAFREDFIGANTRKPPLNFNMSGEIARRLQFAGRPLGLVAAFSYRKSYDFDPDIVRGQTLVQNAGGRRLFVQDELEQSLGGVENLLAGLLVSGGYEISDNDEVKVTFFWNRAADDEWAFTGEINQITGSPTPEDLPPGGDIFLDASDYWLTEGHLYTERSLWTLQAAGDHAFPSHGDATIDWVAAYSESSQDQPNFTSSTLTQTLSAGTTTSSFPGSDFSGEPVRRGWRELQDNGYFLGVNIDTPLFADANGDSPRRLRFGASFDRSTRDYVADNFAYDSFRVSRLPFPAQPADAVGVTAADIVTALDLGLVPPGTPAVFADTFLFRDNARIEYNSSQSIVAGYGSIIADISDDLSLEFGLRAEVVDLTTEVPGLTPEFLFNLPPEQRFFLIFNVETGEPIPPDEIGFAEINEVFVLPAFNATWDFARNMSLRTAFSRTVALPSFNELTPILQRDPLTNDTFAGNQFLQPSRITNADLRWEWYPGTGSDVIAASVFTKLIDQPIERSSSGDTSFFRNEEAADLYGFEIEVQKSLAFLMPALRDVDLSANYTRLVSTVELDEGTRGRRKQAGLPLTRRLQGQPDYIFNFNAVYDNEERGIFMGLFLNVTGALIFEAGGQEGELEPDVLQQPITNLNFTFSKQLTDNWKFTFRGENLTNARRVRVYDPTGNVSEIVRPGIKYSVSFSGEW